MPMLESSTRPSASASSSRKPRLKGAWRRTLSSWNTDGSRFDVGNVFAAVEIKLPNDWIKEQQMGDHVRLMAADKAKVALLRVPEDCTDTKRRA